MTEQSAPDITTGFIQMVEAFKAKPALEQRIAELEGQLSNVNNENRSLVDMCNERDRNLQVANEDKARLTRERDEAMFRSLELEEKTNAVSDLVAKLEGLVRPEPVAKVEAPAPVSEIGKDVGYAEGATSQGQTAQSQDRGEIYDNRNRDLQGQDYGLHEHHPEYSGHEAEQRSNVEDQYRDYHEAHKDSIQSEQGKSEAPNWNAPTKSEQNASEQPMGDTNVKDEDYYGNREVNTPQGHVYNREFDEYQRHENYGKPHSEKPWWVNDNDWRKQGGQGPYEGGSWTAPWERQSA